MIRRFAAWLRRLEDLMLVAVLTVMIVLAIGQVALRNVWGSGIAWAEPLLRILVLWLALLGAMAATRDRNHISIDVLSKFLSDSLKRFTQGVTNGVAALICALLAWEGGQLVLLDYEGGAKAFASVPSWVCELILPFGFGIMGLRFFLYGFQLFIDSKAD